MNLNISNLLNTLQGFYNPDKSAGERYTGTDEGIKKLVNVYGLSSSVEEVTLNSENNFSRAINDLESGVKVTVSSSSNNNFSYKIDNGKIIIFGNNLTINVDESNEDLIEVVGISNVINATSNDDNITLIGFDNEVNAKEGKDNVTVYGEDNTLKDSEVNIFAGIGGQTLIYDDKTFTVGMNEETVNTSKIEIEVDSSNDEVTLKAENAKIIAQDDTSDNINLIGNKNYLDTGVGSDKINVIGENNVVVSGADDEQDEINVSGKNNEISGDENDIVTYTETSGTIKLTHSDNLSHYIKITHNDVVYEYLVERNTNAGVDDVTISYEINENNEIVFTCDNAMIKSQDTNDAQTPDNVVINGKNNYIDLSAGNDNVTINGDGNLIIPGEGEDNITINGQANTVSGDVKDNVYYTENSGSITLTSDDEAAHYIKIDGYEYYITRNENSVSSDVDVTVSYELNSLGVFELKGDNFKIIQNNDDKKDNIKITGNNNYVDTGAQDDEITIVGDNSVVIAGAGDDSVTLNGKNNQADGGEGKDNIASSSTTNTVIDNSFEITDTIYTLNSENEAQTITLSNGNKYTVKLTSAAKKANETIYVTLREREGKITIEADNIEVTAGSKQEDNITFKGSNSKIFAADKDDVINVIGDNNFIDGWSGDDKITATGRGNKAYGFLGNDDITIIQRENTQTEIAEELKNISDNDSNDSTLTDEQKMSIAKENLAKAGANTVDGEFDNDTVVASKYTNISVETEIYKAQAQSMKIKASDDEKKISYTDESGKTYSYTIKTNEPKENNPFDTAIGTRTISYEFVDVEIDGVITKQLVVKGDKISVVADDNQQDNVKVIGNYNSVDLGNYNDYLYSEGSHNMIFGGIGKDFIKVKGDTNKVYGDDELNNKTDSQSDSGDTITVEGSGNTVYGSKGNDVITLYGDTFEAFGGTGDDTFDVTATDSNIYGGKGNNTISYTKGVNNKITEFSNEVQEKTDADIIVLTPEKTSCKFTTPDGLEFVVSPNIEDITKFADKVKLSYKYETGEDGNSVLVLKGNMANVSLSNSSKPVNVRIEGDDMKFWSNGGDDNINVIGKRNYVNAGVGSNNVKVAGDNNTVEFIRVNDTDEYINTVSVNGNYNKVNNVTSDDIVSMAGVNNNMRYVNETERSGGSIVLNQTTPTKTIVIHDRAYEVTMYGIDKKDIETTELNISYRIETLEEEEYIVFVGDNVKIRVLDSRTTPETDENTTDNGDNILLLGNNCYVTGSHGNDAIRIYGNSNIIDGWYGDDSIQIIYGNDNKIRGFGGNDEITITEGNKNKVNGEQGEDKLTIIAGEGNKYENVEKIVKE